MAQSDITKSLKKKRNIFACLSIGLWVGCAIFCAIMTFIKIDARDPSGTPIFSNEFKAFLASLGITAIIGIVVACIIKDKIRTFIWIACTVINSIIYKDVGMYITLGIWLIDEYVLYALYIHYKNRVAINKEIDVRIK